MMEEVWKLRRTLRKQKKRGLLAEKRLISFFCVSSYLVSYFLYKDLKQLGGRETKEGIVEYSIGGSFFLGASIGLGQGRK